MTREEQARGDALLERLQRADRARARDRLWEAGLESLTPYERGLLGRDAITAHQRQERQEAERQHRDLSHREAVAAALTPKDIVWRDSLLERLNAHAIEVCCTYGISVVRHYTPPSYADQETHTIHVKPICSERDYAVALHEVGHIVDPAADCRQFPNHLKEGWLISPDAERGAWAWARRHALEWSPAMQEALYKSLRSYADPQTTTAADRELLIGAVHDGWVHTKGAAWSCTVFGEKIKALRGISE